jgi:hypothetical protein
VAWQNGATGAGVLVGVIDDGIHPNHPELAGRISPNSVDIVPGRNALVTDLSHGSELSSLIAGNYNNAQTVGLAFDATILAVRADNGAGSFTSTDLAAAVDYARTHGVDVINFSLGSSTPTAAVLRDAIQRATAAGIIIVVSAGNDGNSGATNPNYPGFLATDPAIANGLIMIAGGLNPNGSVNPASNPPGTAANWYLTAPGWQIIVPDYGPAGPVPGFQTCGLGVNGNLCQIQGTSYASPHVTGAVALLMDAFPGLTPAQVVDLIFTTTDDTGVPGIDSVNGRGRLNIGRAFQPVGPLAIPLAEGQGSVQTGAPIGVTGAAFGDGLTRNATLWSVVGFDRFNRTFPVDLAGHWLTAAAGPSSLAEAPRLWRSERSDEGVQMQVAFADDAAPESYRLPVDRSELERAATRIDAQLAPNLAVSFAANGARAMYREGDAIGHLDFVNSDVSLRVTHRLGDVASLSFITESGSAPGGVMGERRERSATAALASFDFGRHEFDISYGRIDEESGLLGLSWASALGSMPAGEARFAGLGWRYRPAPDVNVYLNAEFGAAQLASTGWLTIESPLQTSAFSLTAEYGVTPSWFTPFGAEGEGSLNLTLSQPLRIEDGTMSFMAPTANKYGRSSLRYVERQFSPTPSGRELRLGLGYSYFAGDALSAFGEALYVLEPGHVEEADAETILRLGLRVAR